MPDKPLQRIRRIIVSVILLLIVVPVGGFVVWRLRLAHEVNSRLAAIRAAGLPTSGAELNAYYAAVPDKENAALVMTPVDYTPGPGTLLPHLGKLNNLAEIYELQWLRLPLNVSVWRTDDCPKM